MISLLFYLPNVSKCGTLMNHPFLKMVSNRLKSVQVTTCHQFLSPFVKHLLKLNYEAKVFLLHLQRIAFAGKLNDFSLLSSCVLYQLVFYANNALTRRPSHLTTAQDMDVQVVHRLAAGKWRWNNAVSFVCQIDSGHSDSSRYNRSLKKPLFSWTGCTSDLDTWCTL